MTGSAGIRLVVFRLEDRKYGLEVQHVGEIVPMVALAPVPEAPPWLEGVLNLRGRVVPVVNLRVRFGLPRREPGLETPIMIAIAGERTAGFIVDAVDEVLSLPSSSLSPPGELVDPGSVTAVAVAGDGLILVVNPEPLIAASEPLVPAEI